MVMVIEMDETTMKCVKYGLYDAKFQQVPHLNWSLVGVFKCGPTSSEISYLPIDAICGKVLKICNYFITCPSNILREK